MRIVSAQQLSDLLSPRSRRNGEQPERMHALPAVGCQQEVLHCCLFLINLIPLQYYVCARVCIGACGCADACVCMLVESRAQY